MHTSSKGKNSIYQNLTHGPLIPTPHCSPCRAAVQPRMQLPGQELREPTQFQSASWNKEECRNSGKGPITGMGNILKRSWEFKTLSLSLAPLAQTFLMKLHSKLPCQDHTGFCNSLILISQSVFWVRKLSPAQLLTASPGTSCTLKRRQSSK